MLVKVLSQEDLREAYEKYGHKGGGWAQDIIL